jgi:dihydrofolate reductase
MKIQARMCMSLDGYVTRGDGWPAQLADPEFSPQAYGFAEFQGACDAVLMGRTTFEPALGAREWPWGDTDVFVLGSRRAEGTPEGVVVDSDPERLLEQVRSTNRGGNVHIVGGPRTIETFRALGALDELRVIVVPVLLGEGMQLTPSVGADTKLELIGQDTVPAGRPELIYAVG